MKRLVRPLILAWLWRGARRKATAERPSVITVSGSVGKTSTKEALACVLAESGRPVVKTLGNMGTDTGVPLSLLGFSEPPDGWLEWLSAALLALHPPILKEKARPYYVLEYSADKPGDIAFLADQLPFQAAVLTRIVPTHMAYYAAFEELVAEETCLVDRLPAEGYAIINADDPAQEAAAERLAGRVFRYGIASSSARGEGVWAREIQGETEGLRCAMAFSGDPRPGGAEKRQAGSIEVQTRVIGRHQLYPLLAAAAVGWNEGLSLEQIRKGLEAYEIPNGRGRVIAGRKETVLIDDTYNAASPDSVKDGLDMLRPFAGSRRTVAILGRMNELGDIAQQKHLEIGAYAAGKVDFLVAVGEYGEKVAEAAKAAGMPSVHVLSFASTDRLVRQLDQVMQAKDVVYIKGSQNGVRLERVTKALMARPEEADKLLVRQSHYWKARA